MNQIQFWQKHNMLLKNIFYEQINEYETFTYYKSVFKGKYYNFIKPSTSEQEVDWNSIYELLRYEGIEGDEISFHINSTLAASYENTMFVQGYVEKISDFYVTKDLVDRHDLDNLKFELLSTDNFDDYLKAVNLCFTDFDNNAEYCEFNLKQQELNPNAFQTYILYVDNKICAFGSMLMSDNLQMAFLHNLGTTPEFQKKGYFTSVVKFLENIAQDFSAEMVYANVEENGGSYYGFLKLGYEAIDQNYIFSKS